MDHAEPDPSTPPRPVSGSSSESVPAAPLAPPLGERDLQVLDFEREWWRFAGARETAVRERFGLSPADYHQVLGRLIDDDAALAHDPLLVRRLRRQRLVRRRERSARRAGRS